jgi:hypothetical protein
MAANTYTALSGGRLIATGDAGEVARAARESAGPVLIFDDGAGQQVELDPFAEPPALALSAPAGAPAARPGRGRPKLGVVAREVTLLPRHWDWLSGQPGGASAALRRLVEDASRRAEAPDRARRAQEAVYRVMSALAGDMPGFEEAARALFARDDAGFDRLVAAWPADVTAYLMRLAAAERAVRVA